MHWRSDCEAIYIWNRTKTASQSNHIQHRPGPISQAQKCTGRETVEHSTSPIAKGKGVFHSLNINNTNWILTYQEPKLTRNLGLSGVYLLHTYKGSPSELINHVSCDVSGTFSRKWTKTHIFTYFGCTRGHKGAKNMASGDHFTHT